MNFNRSSFVVSDSLNFSSGKPCVFCNEPFHPFVYCQTFLKMSDRIAKIRSLKLCMNCFGSKHFSRNCTKIGCKKCKDKHHSLLHYDVIQNKVDTSLPSTVAFNENLTTVPISVGNNNPNTVANHSTFFVENEFRKSVLLSTAIVLIRDKHNRYIECRALIDQGSQSNFMT